MDTLNRYDGLDPRVVANLRCVARRLARSGGVPGMDLEDLEQDLIFDLWRRLPAYDPRRASLPTFADRVLNHRAATLTASSARLTAERRAVSLDAQDAPDETACAGLVGLHTALDDDDTVGLRLDVARFLDRLTPAQRRACIVLMQPNVAGAARALGMHRSTVYEMRERLRRLATEAGLGIYASPPRHSASVAGMSDAMATSGDLTTGPRTRHLTQEELAERWRVSARSLERWRSEGTGPAFIKLAGRVLYRLQDVEQYESDQRRLAGARA
jgi:RNA polymerase sigma-70 factor (ECF subfamily)